MKLLIRIVPNAKQSEAVGWEGQTLKVRIAAPPIEGRANEELVRLMSELCDCAPSQIEILKGLGSKQKTLDVPNPPKLDF